MSNVVFLVTGGPIPALALLTVYSSIHRIEEGDLGALLMFGRMQRVLQPGLHFAWPFFSETYPIDQQTMTIDKGDERVAVPERFEEEVRKAERWSSADGSGDELTSERAANYVTYLLYVVAVITGWVGATSLAASFELRDLHKTFAGTPLDAPAWIGVVLIATFFPLVYLGNVIRRRFGILPHEEG